MIDFSYSFDCSRHIVGISYGTFRGVDAQAGQPFRNCSGHYPNVSGTGFNKLAHKMRAEEARATGDQRGGRYFLDYSRVPLRALLRHDLGGAFLWSLRH